MKTETFTRNLNTALTAPVFTDRPELVAPFAAMCAEIRAGLDAGAFAPTPISLDVTGNPIDLNGDFSAEEWDGFDFDAEREPDF